MNRISATISQLLTAATLLLPAALLHAADVDAQLEQVRAKVSGLFDSIDAQHVTPSPIDGWYTVQKGSIVAYISADGRYLLQGDLIDLDMQVNLSEKSRSDSRKELVNALDDDDAILFSPAEVKHSVTVFTDVDCTYCRKLHNQIEEYMGYGIAIRYVLYPRNGPASRAWSTSEDVLCSRDPGSALTAAKLDRDFQTSTCNTSMLTRHYTLGQDIGLSGTPAIVFEDGTMVGGYLPPEALHMRLQSAAAR
jgi:thiol:disulfide interchange protein DsbC